MDRLCVLVPGIGYTLQRPLLYWSRRLFCERGYEIMAVEFSPFGKDAKDRIDEAAESAFLQCRALLGGADFSRYKEILFVSKSVGTCAALRFEAEKGLLCKNLLFTPIERTFLEAGEARKKGALGKCLVFHGTADPWVETGRVRSECRELNLSLDITKGANHSLERGDALFDAKNAARVLRKCARFAAGENQSRL